MYDPNVIEVIDWEDHATRQVNNWAPVEEFSLKPVLCRSVGWVIKESPEALIIVASGPVKKEASPDFCSDMMILKKAIVKRKKIKL